MKLGAALAYFAREALVSLRRSWKVGLLAVLTIGVSLFMGGSFLLLTGNLERVVEEWRSEAKVVVYLVSEATAEERAELVAAASSPPFVVAVEEISGEDARQRFGRVFPDLVELLGGWESDPLPASLEIAFDPDRAEGAEMERWMAGLERLPAAAMVDDDRRWLRQIEMLVTLLRAIGLTFGAIFLVAAIFTIASVIRLTAFLYRDEIAVMRLVGATELVIRGPFVVEGLLQGLAGGAVAVGGLYAAYRLLAMRDLPTILGSVFFDRFLPPEVLAGLIGLGGAAGLFAAVISLRGEAVSSD